MTGEARLVAILDRAVKQERRFSFWLRDDDAVMPSKPLDRLISLTAQYDIPLTLAVIPEQTGQALKDRLMREHHVSVAVHGWSHRSYSTPPAKKQELGLDRGIDPVLSELREGHEKLQALYADRCLSMLVPPWNRIAPEIVPALPRLGFGCLSVFGPESPAVLPLLNTHVDIMDWRGTRGGRPDDELLDEVANCLERDPPLNAIGLLAHHLVHDDQAWGFLDRFFRLTADHPACAWRRAADLLS